MKHLLEKKRHYDSIYRVEKQAKVIYGDGTEVTLVTSGQREEI